MKTTQKGIKGFLNADGEWAKHLRPWGKRFFWKGERSAQKKQISDETKKEEQ